MSLSRSNQPVSDPSDDLGKLVSNIQNASDLVNAYWRLSDAGERLRLFTDLARKKPGIAFVCFKTILLNQSDLALRAVTLKSFGELSAFPSLDEDQTKGFIQYLLAEVKGGDPLKQLQAANVLEKLVPPHILSHRELGGLEKPLDRTKRDILDRQVQRISYFNADRRRNSRQEFLGDYEDYLNFWLCGPVQDFFAEPATSNNYEIIVRDLLAQSPIYLLPFGLGQWANSTPLVQGLAMDQARFTFQDQSKQKDLYDLLIWYLEEGQHGVDLRVQAAKIIHTTGSWKSSSEKVQVILKLLLAEEPLRKTAMGLLAPQTQILRSTDTDAAILLQSFQFFDSYTLSKEDNLLDTTVVELTQLKNQVNNQRNQIATTANQGTQATQVLAQRYSLDGAKTRQFLQQQQEQRVNEIDGWSEQLQAQINETTHKQQIVRSNQQLLQQTLQGLRHHDSEVNKKLSQPNLLTSTGYESYQSCQQLYSGLLKLKQELSNATNALYQKISYKFSASSSEVGFWLISGVIVLCLTAISPTLYQAVKPYSPRWIQEFLQPSHSSSSRSQSELAVSKRFANGSLPRCGDTASPDNYWYGVFIPNQGNNLQQVKAMHCRDAALRASDRSEIQVASFAKRQSAQEFADYMRSKYGNAHVGKKNRY